LLGHIASLLYGQEISRQDLKLDLEIMSSLGGPSIVTRQFVEKISETRKVIEFGRTKSQHEIIHHTII